MKILKLILSILAILFAVLGIMNILPYEATNPLMVTCLSATYFITAVEYYNIGNLRNAKYYGLLGVFMMLIVCYVSIF